MKYILTLTILLSLMTSIKCQTFKEATEQESIKIEKAIKKSATETNSIISNFQQEKHLAFFEEAIISKGNFFFKKPNKLRWEYTTPINYLILVDGEKMYIKDDVKTSSYNLTDNIAFKMVNDMLIGMISGNVLNNEHFNAKFFLSPESYKIELHPNDVQMKDYINVIELYFELKSQSVNKVIIREQGTDYTSFHFLNEEKNRPISDEKFTMD